MAVRRQIHILWCLTPRRPSDGEGVSYRYDGWILGSAAVMDLDGSDDEVLNNEDLTVGWPAGLRFSWRLLSVGGHVSISVAATVCGVLKELKTVN